MALARGENNRGLCGACTRCGERLDGRPNTIMFCEALVCGVQSSESCKNTPAASLARWQGACPVHSSARPCEKSTV